VLSDGDSANKSKAHLPLGVLQQQDSHTSTSTAVNTAVHTASAESKACETAESSAFVNASTSAGAGKGPEKRLHISFRDILGVDGDNASSKNNSILAAQFEQQSCSPQLSLPVAEGKTSCLAHNITSETYHRLGMPQATRILSQSLPLLAHPSGPNVSFDRWDGRELEFLGPDSNEQTSASVRIPPTKSSTENGGSLCQLPDSALDSLETLSIRGPTIFSHRSPFFLQAPSYHRQSDSWSPWPAEPSSAVLSSSELQDAQDTVHPDFVVSDLQSSLEDLGFSSAFFDPGTSYRSITSFQSPSEQMQVPIMDSGPLGGWAHGDYHVPDRTNFGGLTNSSTLPPAQRKRKASHLRAPSPSTGVSSCEACGRTFHSRAQRE
jgi:hypothetical protein